MPDNKDYSLFPGLSSHRNFRIVFYLFVAFVVVGFVVHRQTFEAAANGPEFEAGCRNMLINVTSSKSQKNPWRTHGCKIHQYSLDEVKQCFNKLGSGERKVRLVLIGDSRIRNFQEHFQISLGREQLDWNRRPQHDFNWKSDEFNLNVHLFWVPYMHNFSKVSVISAFSDPDHPPDLILMGNSLWHMEFRPEGEESLQAYQLLFGNSFKPILEDILSKQKTKFVWMMQPKVLRPIYFSRMHNDVIINYNHAAEKALRNISKGQSEFYIWSSLRQVVEEVKDPLISDQLHFAQHVLAIGSNILYNLLCNRGMEPEDNACCA